MAMAASNLQIAPPLNEVSAAPTADDAVSRILSEARISDGPSLLDALEARRNELHLSNSAVEKLANLCEGHLTKVCGPARQKSPSLMTLDKIMTALGLSFVLVCDPTKMQSQWRPRDERKVRQRALSPTTISRARPHVLAELARRAARPRWAGVDARTFLQEMAGDDA
jgi:hypothetical protein